MKKVIAWLLVLALTAAVSIGATLAYLTDTDEDVNVMTLGKVKIDQLEYERIDDESKNESAEVQEFRDNKPLYPSITESGFDYKPGDTYVDWKQIGKDGYTSDIWDPAKINNEVDKMVFVKNKGDYDAYVRSVFAFEAGNYKTLDEFRKMVHLNLNEEDWTWGWMTTPVTIGESTYFVATATYNEKLAPGALTEISLSQIALDKTATNEDVKAFGDTYQVLVKSQAVQADGFDDADTALTEGFGKVTASSVPWKNDSPYAGIDLYTALHYYEGDTSKDITRSITKVVYALNKEYPEIVSAYDATLVDVEQDVPVDVYYVPNGSNYDIYCLADDTIYSPKNSSGLYKNMRALQFVDTHNYDVSRVENMHELFRYCHSLKDIDVSKWDVSNVKDMFSVFDECKLLTSLDISKWDLRSAETTAYMFYGCNAMETLPVGDWNTSNITSMCGMFERCTVLPEIDVGDWNTANVTDMASMFKGCFALTELDIGSWDTGNVQAFNSMFSGTGHNTGEMKFTELPIEDWDMSSAINIGYMFYGCGNLTKLDLHKWDVSKVTTMHHTFADCSSITEYNFTGWNTESLETMDGIFNSNLALESVNVSDFDTQNVYDFDQVFDGCTALEEIIGLDQWDTSNGKYFIEFLLNTKMREIDLSSFNMTNAKELRNMFHVNSELTTIYVGDKWNFDPDNLDTNGNSGRTDMFTACPKLTGANGSTIAKIGSAATNGRVDTPETPGLLTHINDKPVTP